MSKKINITIIKNVTRTTPFDDSLTISQRTQIMFIFSSLTLVVVAWLLQELVWGGQPTGFINLPESSFLLLTAVAGALAIIAIAALFLYLPKITSPAAVLDRKAIDSLEALGFELSQAQLLRLNIAYFPAILGLILYLLNGHIPLMLIFVGVSILLLLFTFPRKDDWEEAKRLFEKQQLMRG